LGDKDKTTSLRTLEKTDFFTKEIDTMLLSGECRIGIHSAKDLPEPIPEGLAIIALTRGVDPADVLIMRSGDTFSSLKQGAVIATSSERREMMVRSLRSDLRFIDLRGTIGERLEKLNSGEADGVVVAEAALIRLKLTHLNRMILPGETAVHQGQLAILARQDDQEMARLYACLDVRQAAPKRILHVGLQPPSPKAGEKIVHCPLIRIVPRPLDAAAFAEMASYTHLIFTSKSAVEIFCSYQKEVRAKEVFAVGHATAICLLEHGIHVTETAQDERAEGIIALLEKRDLSQAYLFWPHSAQARTVLRDYFDQKGMRYRECPLYDTLPLRPERLPDLAQFDEIHFTSPSTVEAFVQYFGQLPQDKILKAIGTVTASAIKKTQAIKK
ncbi:MAG: uroporphyrinogen-III synthase, partial [Parachlamydia sp.]|nr:uroporphyrinogen-III synthase [Parachlamydia sp.]